MDTIEEIKKLKALLDQGAITQEEFNQLKKKIIESVYQDVPSIIQDEPPVIQASQNNSTSNNYTSEESSSNHTMSTYANLPQQTAKVNYPAIFLAALIAISVFLPWAELSSSASFGGYSSKWSGGGISGISLGYGIVGLLMAIVGCILVFAKTKWASLFGLINVIDGIGYALGWFNAHYSSSYGGVNAEAGVNPQFGLFMFIIASFLFIIFSLTFKYVKPVAYNNIKKGIEPDCKKLESNGLSIGQDYGGGIIAYFDRTGKYVGIVSKSDISEKMNFQQAKFTCEKLNLEGYSDWFLPNGKELNAMYRNLHVKHIGNFKNERYWNDQPAQEDKNVIDFSDHKFYDSEKTKMNFVRPIRLIKIL